MNEIATYELTTGRAHPDYWLDTLQRMAEARAAVAAVLVADAADIALTHSATDGMNIGAWSIDWKAGDRAVTTRLEHPGGTGALHNLRERFGIEIAYVDVGAAADQDAVLAAFDAAIDERTQARGRLACPVGDRRGPAHRRHRRDRPRARSAHDRGRCPGRGRHPGRAGGDGRRRVRGVGPEMAARPGGDGRHRRRARGARSPAALVRRVLLLRDRRSRGRGGGLAGRAAFRVLELPPAIDRRDGAFDRVAEHVRRARLDLRARCRPWPASRPTGWPPSPGSSS